MEEKMESRMTMIVCAGGLSVLWSLPANAGEKITGRNSDYQLLSEVTATIPDKPGHILRQRTTIFKSTSNSARLGDAWITQAAHEVAALCWRQASRPEKTAGEAGDLGSTHHSHRVYRGQKRALIVSRDAGAAVSRPIVVWDTPKVRAISASASPYHAGQ
jgi:hypothetical protein